MTPANLETIFLLTRTLKFVKKKKKKKKRKKVGTGIRIGSTFIRKIRNVIEIYGDVKECDGNNGESVCMEEEGYEGGVWMRGMDEGVCVVGGDGGGGGRKREG